MITIRSNLRVTVELTKDALERVADTDKLLRLCATSTLFLMKKRIHEDGLDAAEAPIGQYSKRYMAVRIRRGRTADTRVVASLTRQMENDMKVIALGNGYGIGFSNPLNFQKSQWVEKRYNRPAKIYRLSPSENQAITVIVEKHTKDAFPR